jgi:hypothetical protein
MQAVGMQQGGHGVSRASIVLLAVTVPQNLPYDITDD